MIEIGTSSNQHDVSAVTPAPEARSIGGDENRNVVGNSVAWILSMWWFSAYREFQSEAITGETRKVESRIVQNNLKEKRGKKANNIYQYKPSDAPSA